MIKGDAALILQILTAVLAVERTAVYLIKGYNKRTGK